MATHSSVLAWRIPGMGEPGGLPSMGSHRVGHDWSNLAAAGSSVHGILQARMLEWVAISSSRSSQPRNVTQASCVSCIGRWILYRWATQEAQERSQGASKFKVKPWIVNSVQVRGMLLADDREGERVPMGVDTIFCVYFSVWYCEGGNWEPGNMGGSQKNAARQELGSWKSTRMHRVVQTNVIIQGHLVTVGHSLKTWKEDEILGFRAWVDWKVTFHSMTKNPLNQETHWKSKSSLPSLCHSDVTFPHGHWLSCSLLIMSPRCGLRSADCASGSPHFPHLRLICPWLSGPFHMQETMKSVMGRNRAQPCSPKIWCMAKKG